MKSRPLILALVLAMATPLADAKKHHNDHQQDESQTTSETQTDARPTKAAKSGQDVDTWTDPATGLTWTRCPLGDQYVAHSATYSTCDQTEKSQGFTFPEAMAIVNAANSEKINDVDGWRLPTIAELESVMVGCVPDPTNDNACDDRGHTFRVEVPVGGSWVATQSSKKPGEMFYVDNSFGFQTDKIDGGSCCDPVKHQVVLVRGTSSLKASIDPDILLGKVKSDGEAADAKEVSDAQAAHEKLLADRVKAEDDQHIANEVFNAKLVEARKHMKRGDTVIYRDQQAFQAYTVLVLAVDQDSNMVQIQLRNGDAIYVRTDQVNPYVK